MGIKIKYRTPKSTDFSKNDRIINVREGALYFKSEFGVHRIVSEVKEISYGSITGAPTIPPDYGPHPDYTGVYSEVGHTHAAPTITNYFYAHFGNDWGNQTTEKGIAWAGTSEQSQIKPQLLFVMPYSGVIHRLYWKQTGVCNDVTVKVYKNINDDSSTFTAASSNTPIFSQNFTSINVGTGDGADYVTINDININKTFAAGDHILITLQAASDGIDEISGQLLYSQDITT